MSSSPDRIAKAAPPLLLNWYDRHARQLPWRALPGEKPDPYRVWLSEIMLQQTTVAAVKAYFEDFTTRWPKVGALAKAPQDEVLAAWAGLGYYARARNLHRCAQVIQDSHEGQFPQSEAELQTLPGVGPYTAAAISAIAFNQTSAPVDGNIERVISRLWSLQEPLPDSKPAIKSRMAEMVPKDRPGDFAQAMMDLGAGICTPKTPKCMLCPLESLCLAKAQNCQSELPRKRKKAAKPTRKGRAYWLERSDGAVLLRRRPPKGLLGGLLEIPSTGWSDEASDQGGSLENSALEWQKFEGQVRHTFTHFHLELEVWGGRLQSKAPQPHGEWVPLMKIGEVGLPSLMQKVARHALAQSASLMPADEAEKHG